jgi:hypothetical protein
MVLCQKYYYDRNTTNKHTAGGQPHPTVQHEHRRGGHHRLGDDRGQQLLRIGPLCLRGKINRVLRVVLLVRHDILPSELARGQGRRFAEIRHELAVQRNTGSSLVVARQQWRQHKAWQRRTAQQWQRGGSSPEAAAMAAERQQDIGGSMAGSAAVAAAQSAAAGHSKTAVARWQQHGGCGGVGSAIARRRRQRHRPRMRRRMRLQTPPTR